MMDFTRSAIFAFMASSSVRIEGAFTPHDELIVRFHVAGVEQGRFDLGREDVDPANHHHVVGAAGEARDAAMGASAAAGLVDDVGQVVGAVAQKGHALLGQGGDHQLPFFAVGHRLAGVRIDDFKIEKVLPEVQAVLLFALDGDARPADFAHTIDVKGLDGQAFLDGFAHVFRPGLRAEDSGLKRQRGRVDARVPEGLAQIAGVGRGAGQMGGLEILHQHDLAGGVPAGHGDHGRAHALGAAVNPDAPGEQAVAIGVVDDGVLVGAGPGEPPGHTFGPHGQIVVGITVADGLARRPGRGLHPGDLRQGFGQHAVGIAVSQILLRGEGQPADIVQAVDAFRPDAQRLQLFPIKGHPGVDLVHRLLQPVQLQRPELLPGHALKGFIPIFHTFLLR